MMDACKRAAAYLREFAEDIRAANTVGGEWFRAEDAKAEHDELLALADELTAAPVPAPPAERYSPKMGRDCDGRYVEMVPDPHGEWVRYAAPAAEPVAQQPEDIPASEAIRRMSRIASEVAAMPIEEIRQELAAQQPPPTQDDGLVAWLRSLASIYDAWSPEAYEDAAARIESDAARIRTLEAAAREHERELDEVMEERDRYSDALLDTSMTMGGPEWCAKLPPEEPPNSGDLARDVPLLAAASRERERLYAELIYAVASKFPGETRHETALRYIRNAERGSDQCAKAATTPDSAASP